MSSYLPVILQAIITISGVTTLVWKIQTANAKKQSEEIKKIRDDYESKIKTINKEIESWEERRKIDVRGLHKRIDAQDDFVKKQIIGQLSKMEGEMKQMSRNLTIIQEHFVRTGAGER